MSNARFDRNLPAILELCRTLARRMSNRTGVPRDDLAQEGLIATWQAIPDWPRDTEVKWFSKVINWRMIDYVRRVREGSRDVVPRPANVEYTDARHDYSDAHDATADVDDHLMLMGLAASDPQDTADALRLEEGWKLRDIAADAGVSESAASYRRKAFFARARADKRRRGVAAGLQRRRKASP